MEDNLKLESNLPGDIAELQTPVDFVVSKPSGINYTDSMYISCRQTNKDNFQQMQQQQKNQINFIVQEKVAPVNLQKTVFFYQVI